MQEDKSSEEVVEWILNVTQESQADQVRASRPSPVTLGVATLALALMSAAADYVLLVRLIKSKVKNITLLTMKSCVCADLLSTLMFLVFVCPAWFSGKVIYSSVTCSVEGFLTAWTELSLHAGLVFLLIQRYVLAHKMKGYKIFRDKHRLCLVCVWLVTGVISSLPFVYSIGIYVHNKSLNHCVLDSRTVRLFFDILNLFVPAVFLLLAAVVNGQSSQFLQKHGIGSLQRDDLPNSRDGLISVNAETMMLDCHALAMAGEVTMGILATATLNSCMTGIETTLAFNIVAYNTAVWTLSIFGLRSYGTWTAPGFSLSLATTHLLGFASSFTRAVIFLMVGQISRPYLRERGFLDDTQPSSASSDRYRSNVWRWTHTDTSTSDATIRTRDGSQSKRESRVAQTSLSESPIHTPCHSDMAAFWSNKPCNLTMCGQMMNLMAEPAPHKETLGHLDSSKDAESVKNRRDSDDYAEVFIKASQSAKSKKRQRQRENRKSRGAHHSFSLLSAFGPEDSRQQCKDAEAKVLLSTSTQHKDSATGGEFVWLNRVSDSECKGVTIYDRFLVEKTNRSLSSLLLGLTATEHASDACADARRQSEDTDVAIRLDNGVGATVVEQRRRIVKRHVKKESMDAASEQNRSSCSGSLELTLTSLDDKLSKREEGKLRYLKKPPPGRLLKATYSYKTDK